MNIKKYIKNENRNTLTFNNEDGSITIIPISESNSSYQQFLEEQARGEAELVPYTPPAPTWEEIRAQRNQLLQKSDWVVLPDVAVENKEQWLAYRQQLRDITKNFETPQDVKWPPLPE